MEGINIQNKWILDEDTITEMIQERRNDYFMRTGNEATILVLDNYSYAILTFFLKDKMGGKGFRATTFEGLRIAVLVDSDEQVIYVA